MSKVDGKKEKVFGIDLDPADHLNMTTDREGYPNCTYKDKFCTTEDYLDKSQENAERHFKDKKSNNTGVFSGFGSGTLAKPYKN